MQGISDKQNLTKTEDDNIDETDHSEKCLENMVNLLYNNESVMTHLFYSPFYKICIYIKY